MKKIVATWFTSIQDVDEYLKWLEDNTLFIWQSVHKPTDDKTYWWWYKFEEYNLDWFAIPYHDLFSYGKISHYKDNGYKEVNFKQIMKENSLNLTKGDLVEVSMNWKDWKEKIYISTEEGCTLKYKVLDDNYWFRYIRKKLSKNI
jgi:hypothetical protein